MEDSIDISKGDNMKVKDLINSLSMLAGDLEIGVNDDGLFDPLTSRISVNYRSHDNGLYHDDDFTDDPELSQETKKECTLVYILDTEYF